MKWLAIFVVVVSQMASFAFAQPARRGFGFGPRLELGKEAPGVTVLDENGEEFSLKSVRGKHVVLVFGCLT